MLKGIIINFIGIFNSRILGFIRDLLSANILGASIYSDIFFVAFKFPNLFRRIFAEGAFTQAFIPSFSKEKYKAKFASKIFILFLLFLVAISIIVNIFSYEVTSILAYGFDEKLKKLTAPILAINFWYLDLIFIVTFFASLLQYKNHFATTAFSTALLNISMIGALIISKDMPKEKIVYYLSYGVVFGGLMQVIAHLIAAKYKGILKFICIGFKSKKKVNLNEFKRIFLPSIIGNSTAHISAFIDTWLASFLTAGSISYLYYANRLFQLPFALFAIATSTVLFPKITKALSQNEITKAQILMQKSFWYLLYMLLFAFIITIIANKEIVALLFERGEFKEKDTQITANVLVMYIIGLIPFGINKLFNSFLYATHKHIKAAKISTISLIINIIFSIVLIFPMKVYGLALASSIGGWSLLILTLKEYGYKNFFRLFEKRYIFIMFVVIIFSIIVGVIFKEILIFIKGLI